MAGGASGVVAARAPSLEALDRTDSERTLLRVESIANAAHGRRDRSVRRLQLGAQAREVWLQPLRVRVVLAGPARCQQPGVRHDPAARLDEDRQQRELDPCQRQRFSVNGRTKARGIEGEAADSTLAAARVGTRRRTPSYHGADS